MSFCDCRRKYGPFPLDRMLPKLFRGSKCSNCKKIAKRLYRETGYFRSIELLDSTYKSEKIRLDGGAILTTEETKNTYNMANIMNHFACYGHGGYSRWKDFRENYLVLLLVFTAPFLLIGIIMIITGFTPETDLPLILLFSLTGIVVGIALNSFFRNPISDSRIIAESDRKAGGIHAVEFENIPMDKWNRWLHKLNVSEEELAAYELTDQYIFELKEKHERELLTAIEINNTSGEYDDLENRFYEADNDRERLKILRQIKDPSILAKICINHEKNTIAGLILDLLDDDYTHAYIARCVQEVSIIQKAIDKITNKKILKDIFENSINLNARIAAVGKIKGDDYLIGQTGN